jgi:biopolymer transport protein ExbB/TolQ
MLFANSLIDGFMGSNLMGKGLVLVQLLGSVVMVAVIIGKWKELQFLSVVTRRFLRDFMATHGVLDYYLNRRPSPGATGVINIYAQTCERLLNLLTPDVRSLVAARQTDGDGAAALTEREVKLVQSTSENVLEDESIKVEHGMGVIATVVSLEPMLGLLGTVWGVLDAFAEMGSAGSANLATIAPSISAALVTTVVGLLIAIPGVIAFARMNATIRNLTADMEGFVDELNGRIACEYQGRGL